MTILNLPQYEFRIKKTASHSLIFDEIRKKFLVLTPEEWVRQNFIRFLIAEKGYPASLMHIEGGLKLNGHHFRSDLLIYNKKAEPLLLVEFKAPEVKISQATFNQIARYNQYYKVPYLIVSNGMQHYCCKLNKEFDKFDFLRDIPNYHSIK